MGRIKLAMAWATAGLLAFLIGEADIKKRGEIANGNSNTAHQGEIQLAEASGLYGAGCAGAVCFLHPGLSGPVREPGLPE